MEGLDAKPAGAALNLAETPLPVAVKALELQTRGLPTGQDFHFYSNFQEFKGSVANLQNRVVALLDQLGSFKAVRSHGSNFTTDFDESFDWLVGVQDDLLERVDASLESFYAERKDYFKERTKLKASETSILEKISSMTSKALAAEQLKSGDVKVARSKDKGSIRSPVPFHIPSIPRPQDKFDQEVDNSNTPFRHPGLTRKVEDSVDNNAMESTDVSSLENAARKTVLRSATEYIHPLESELMEMAFVDGLLETVEVRKYDSVDQTPLNLITTSKGLQEMVVKIRTAGEIAVDLENHHYRSYQGFVCLMQVSTRNEDFIVDTLELRSQIGPILGGIFSDPTIKKVMHGADHDIIWLQRDFGIYVCNLFDTGQAARVLQLPGFGLGYLLEHFCEVHSDKRFQLADWRIRPLPSEMLKYAREDTHYLLYVHDLLKQQLLSGKADGKVGEEDLFLQVCKRSRDICLQLYSKDLFTETSYQQLYGLREKNFQPEQIAVLAALYAWRDQMARKEDESTGYVLPNHLLYQLVTEMPDNVRHLQSFLKGRNTLVGQNAAVIVDIIVRAREKAVRECDDTHLEHEVHKQLREPIHKLVLAGGKSEAAESKMSLSTQVEEICSKTASSSQSEARNDEGKFLANFVQAGKSIDQSEAIQTIVKECGQDVGVTETTGADQENEPGCAGLSAVTDKIVEVEGLELTPKILPGPVTVSRRTSSSFFSSRQHKNASIPPSSSLSMMPGMSCDVSDRVPKTAAFLAVSGRNPLSSVKDSTSEVLSTDHVNAMAVDTGHSSEALVALEKAGTGTDVTSTDTEFHVPLNAPTEICLHVSVDNLPGVPDITIPHGSLETTEEGSKNSFTVANVPVPTFDHIVVGNVPFIQPKRNISKLGGLLGGGTRLSSVNDLQVEGRVKTQHIESSLLLPFMSSAVVQSIPQHLTIGKQADLISESLEKATNSSGEQMKVDTAGVLIETIDRPCQVAEPAGEDSGIFMFEPDDDICAPSDASGAIMDTNVITTKALRSSGKLRDGFPSSAPDFFTLHGRDASLCSQLAHDSVSDQCQDKSGRKSNSELPLSLSEMHGNSKSRKRNRNHPGQFGELGKLEVYDNLQACRQGKKKARETIVNAEGGHEVKTVVNNGIRVGGSSFNYKEARNSLGIENLYVEMDDKEGRGRGRVAKRGRNKPQASFNNLAFDPMKRVREDLKPDGIKPGQRRQVFPQTGNRTTVFKK